MEVGQVRYGLTMESNDMIVWHTRFRRESVASMSEQSGMELRCEVREFWGRFGVLRGGVSESAMCKKNLGSSRFG